MDTTFDYVDGVINLVVKNRKLTPDYTKAMYDHITNEILQVITMNNIEICAKSRSKLWTSGNNFAQLLINKENNKLLAKLKKELKVIDMINRKKKCPISKIVDII